MEEEHEQRHTLLEAQELITRQTLLCETNLAQFRADEIKRIRVSYQLAQARTEEKKALVAKARQAYADEETAPLAKARDPEHD